MLTIHALVVSVDFSSELAMSIHRWMAGLASLVVVTCARDEQTTALARSAGAALHVTESFWQDDALFNKSRAMQEAREHLPPEGFHLFLDADVIPPADWSERLELEAPAAGTLHGARRVREDGAPIDDRELAGFFQLFHSADPRAAQPLDRNWLHAGNYDSAFMRRWPRDRQRILGLELVHLGETGVNWCGRGNAVAMEKIRERRRRGHSWTTETVGGRRR